VDVDEIQHGVWRHSGACAVFIHVQDKCVPLSCHIATLEMWRYVRLSRVRVGHLHHTCAPLSHQMTTLGMPRYATVLPWVRGAHFQLPWLSLAAPGCSWLAAPGCSGLLLAAPSGLLLAALGCSWLLLVATGCSWLLLAAPGCLWLLLASLSVIDVNSRSKHKQAVWGPALVSYVYIVSLF
jgi:hypothetical protein